jgi:hypothetical protein
MVREAVKQGLLFCKKEAKNFFELGARTVHQDAPN